MAQIMGSEDALVQSFLNIDLNKISQNEREKVYEDLHGVSGLVDESPELLASCLAELEQEIAKIRGRDAYIAAASEDSSYTSSRTLRLQFLRAEHFDSKKAAARLVGFFEKKLELFGPDPLARDLLISDLNEEDQKCLQRGIMTLVPEKDKAGRGIMTWMPMLKEGLSVVSKLRCIMYLFCAAAEDEDVQKKGIVCVVMTLGPRCRGLLLDVPSAFKIPPLLGVFPVRVDAVHLGSDRSSIPANFAKIFPFVWSAMGARMRVRSRYYIGGVVELFYQLKCVGIPTEYLPLDMDGQIHLEYHAKWYQNRQAIETALHRNAMQEDEHTPQLQPTPFSEPRLLVNETNWVPGVAVSNLVINERRGSSSTEESAGSSLEQILEPFHCDYSLHGNAMQEHIPQLQSTPFSEPSRRLVFDDTKGKSSIVELEPFPYEYEPHENAVLCGRGRMCKEACGNLRLQKMCKTFLKEYAQDTGKKGKSEIVSNIMEMVRASCAPSDGFVRFNDDRWWEVDDVTARQKVTGMLRDSLSSKYKSSTQAKVAKRRMQNVLSSIAAQKGS